MNTLLPSIGFARSASQLDDKRLRNQIVEVNRMLELLTYGGRNELSLGGWRGYEGALALYGLAICHEYRIERKLPGDEWGLVAEWSQRVKPSWPRPPWIGDLAVHRSHRSNLIRRDSEFYLPVFGGDTPRGLPYLWPQIDLENRDGYRLAISRLDIPRIDRGERYAPPEWSIDRKTKEVTILGGSDVPDMQTTSP